MKRFPVAITLLLLMASSALAAPGAEISLVDIFKGQGDPQTNQYLNMIFGSLFPVIGTSGTQTETLVSRLIANFNVIFFAIGLLLLVYNIIVGVTETAHDGSVLGQRHSSLWSPIRMIVAAASLIPLPTGYNGAQHAIAYVVNAGTATGSFFWDETVTALVQDKMPVSAPDFVSLDAQFIQAFWRMELCKAAYNVEVGKGGKLDDMRAGWAKTKKGEERSPAVFTFSLPNRLGACGMISLPPAPGGFERVAASSGGTYKDWETSIKTSIDSLHKDFEGKAIEVATNASERKALPETRDLYEDMTAWRAMHKFATDPIIAAVDEQARRTATEELNGSGSNGERTTLAANMKAGGWVRAGFYYQIISRYSADAAAVQRMMPVMSPGDAIGATANPTGQTFQAVRSQMSGGWFFGGKDSDTREFLQEVVNTYNTSVNWWNESVARSGIEAFTNERQSFADTAGELSSWMPSPDGMFDAFRYLNPLKGGDVDPLVAIMTIGNILAVAATFMISGLAILAAVPLVGGASVFLGSVLGWVLSGTAFMGMFLSFVLPLVPTLIWVISVGAFFLLVVEAIFAGPLWAIAHLSMDRNGGLAGPNARRGYVMLLSLFLTPVLMLFGFLVGMAFFRIMGTLVNGGFYYAMTAAQSLTSDSYVNVVSIFAIFASLVVLGFLYLIILERSFAFGAELPGRVLRWFDNMAVDLDDRSADRARVGAAAGTVGASGTLQRIGGQAGRKIEKRNDEHRRQKKLQQ